MTNKEEWREFLDWFNLHKYNLPEGFTYDMSMEQVRLLWKEKKQNKEID